MAASATKTVISHEVRKLDSTYQKTKIVAFWDCLALKLPKKNLEIPAAAADAVGRHVWAAVVAGFLEAVRDTYIGGIRYTDEETASFATLLVTETMLMCMRNRWALELESPKDQARRLRPGSELHQATEKGVVEQNVIKAREWNGGKGYKRLQEILGENTDYLDGLGFRRVPVYGKENKIVGLRVSYDEQAHDKMTYEERILRAYLGMLFSDQQDTPNSDYKSWEEFIKIFIHASKDREAVRQHRVKGSEELLDNSHLQALENLRQTLNDVSYDGPLGNKAMMSFFTGKVVRDLNHPDMKAACGPKG